MSYRASIAGALAAVVVAGSVATAEADELIGKARKVFEEKRDTVVTVRLVIKSQFSVPGSGSQSSESRQEVAGTVIDPSGLTVLSLTMTDPSRLYKNLMSGRQGAGNFQMETQLESIAILRGDGSEIPAEIVLRDSDLDMAFARPIDAVEESLPAVDLNDSAEAEVLERILALTRLGPVAQRAHAASFEWINAIVEKPRRFYIPGTNMTSTQLGSPAFSSEGKIIGVFLMRSVRSGGGGGGMNMFNMQPQNVAPVIIPAADVQEASKQVPEREAKEE